MRYLKVLTFCALLVFQSLISIDSFSQCTAKLDYQVKSDGKGTSSINIKSLEGSSLMKIQLYDMNLGKVVDEKEIRISTSFNIAFKDVKTSRYMFYIWLPGCKRPSAFSGNEQGILIEN